MRYYLGIDDTDNAQDNLGTGKLARWLEGSLPQECSLWGVVRQQLNRDSRIPYTSHNSAACVVVKGPEGILEKLIQAATKHLLAHSLPGSDPGLCAAEENEPRLAELLDFGAKCSNRISSQQEAMRVCGSRVHLSGHGGTNDGIIGAAACVGLTYSGWHGRFIEFGKLREIGSTVKVKDLEAMDILVTSLERDAEMPDPEDTVETNDWCRPRLWGDKPVLPLLRRNNGSWISLGKKRNKAHGTITQETGETALN